jgi:hypothetical protein
MAGLECLREEVLAGGLEVRVASNSFRFRSRLGGRQRTDGCHIRRVGYVVSSDGC